MFNQSFCYVGRLAASMALLLLRIPFAIIRVTIHETYLLCKVT